MKLKLYALFIFLGLTIISCSIIDNLLSFNISKQYSFEIPSGIPVGVPISASTPEMTNDTNQEFENNNSNVNLVKDVRLKELKLTITDPTEQTFSFLKSVHLYISTTNDNEIEIAYLDDINSTENYINLISTNKKLDQYIKASSFKIRASTVTKETIANNISITADMKFRVTADPL